MKLSQSPGWHDRFIAADSARARQTAASGQDLATADAALPAKKHNPSYLGRVFYAVADALRCSHLSPVFGFSRTHGRAPFSETDYAMILPSLVRLVTPLMGIVSTVCNAKANPHSFRAKAPLCIIVSVALLSAPDAHAATIQVGLPFSGSCSLRSAIQTANTNTNTGGCSRNGSLEPDTINLQAGAYQTESSLSPPYYDEDANVKGDLDISSEIIIQGISPQRSNIAAPDLDRLFDVQATGSLTLRDMTIHGGSVSASSAPDGGAIRKAAGATLTLERVYVRGGTAARGGAVYGAMTATGALTLRDVTITEAFASSVGGGLAVSGSGGTPALTLLTNVTLSGNTAPGGSALYISATPLRMLGSTVAFNHATGSFGAVRYLGTPPAKPVEIVNSVLTENTQANGAKADLSCSTGIQLLLRSHSLISAISTCSFATNTSNPATNENARLLPLFDYGGGIPVHALANASAATNAGFSGSLGCAGTDARGATRFNPCDIGAYEQVFDAFINSTADLPDLTPGDGLCRASGNVCTLRAASMEANAFGGRWFVGLSAGTYLLDRPITNVDDLGGDLDFRPNSTATPPLSFTLFGLDNPANTHIVGGGTDRVIEVRGRFEIENSGSYAHRYVSFALFNATVRGGNQGEDQFLVEPDNEPAGGGGVTLVGGHSLFHHVVIRDNQLRYVETQPPSILNFANGAGVNIDVSRGDMDGYRLVSSARFERFAVIDNIGQFTADSYSVQGGGLWAEGSANNESGTVVLVNGTIAGNEAYFSSGLRAGNVNSTFLTIHDNLVPIALIAGNTGQSVTSSGVRGSMRNVIISGNRFGVLPSDCAGNIATLGHVLIGNTANCTTNGDSTGNQLNVDPQLSARQTNAFGMVFYRAIQGSPAIDAIDLDRCSDHAGFGTSIDAPGSTRPLVDVARCDIGAIEGALPSPLLFADGFEN